jgi:Raf kinase inhibitor-like YbhB/YbcL family protein
MRLTSSAFQNNGKIPEKYTCEGNDINPPLKIEFVPALAKSLALIVDDPDIPDFVKQKFHIEMWDHWVVFNIPTNVTELEEDERPPGVHGKNSSHRNEYMGPCPPDREHRYFFRLYSLDSMLDLHEGATKAEVIKAMEGHLLAKAELVGRYEKKNK